MARRSRLTIALVAALGALAIIALPGTASAKDRNGDHIPDRWETQHHLSLQVNQAGRDQDHDGLRNRGEFRAGDNPRDRDSDGDGVIDGEENAGTVTAFDPTSGKLTIAVFNGDSISGLVSSATEIKCEGVEDRFSGVSGRDHGSGETEPGDDHGGRGEEPGDDNGHQGEEPGGNSGPGSANSGPGRGDEGQHGDGVACTTADLTVGAVVHEADLEIEHGVASFDEVELAHTN